MASYALRKQKANTKPWITIAIEFVVWAGGAMANSALPRPSVSDLPALQNGHIPPGADGDDEEAGEDGKTS